MKRILTALTVLFLSMTSCLATVRTLCNMPYSPGQYTTFAAALAASAVNDTIYVHGSSINYGSVTINKNGIVVIGTGHNPAKTIPLLSLFNIITITATGCQLIGLTVDNITGSIPSSSTTVKRCRILATPPLIIGIGIASGQGDNWLIEGNVFDTASPNTNITFNNGSSSNTIIRNNIFNATIWNNSATTADNTFIITNNIFLSSNDTFNNIFDATITNNIFYHSNPETPAGTSTMSYNISYLCGNNNFSAPGANNLTNVNPQFNAISSNLFSYSNDYGFIPGSPAIASGADGTDRGVFGGFGTKFTMTGEPPIAEITNFTITSPTTIAPNGTLTISVTSKRIK